MEIIPFITVTLNRDGKIVDFQSTLFGSKYLKKSVLGKNWFDIFIDPLDREKMMHVFKEVLNNSLYKVVEYLSIK